MALLKPTSPAPLVLGLVTGIPPQRPALAPKPDAALVRTLGVGPNREHTDAKVASARPSSDAVARTRTAAPALAIHMDPQGIRVSVTGQERPLTDLLAALAHESGIVVHLQPQPASVVKAAFQDDPVEGALKRLFGREAQHVFGYKTSRAAVPVEVWVWQQPTYASLMPRPVAGLAFRGPAHSAPKNLARQEEIRAVIEQQVWADIRALVDAFSDDGAVVRRDAVAGLAPLPSDSVVETLAERLRRENDPSVRTPVAPRDRR